MFQVSGPKETIQGIFHSPCDHLHLRVEDWYLAELHERTPSALANGSQLSRFSGFQRDRASEQPCARDCYSAHGLPTIGAEGWL
jgi:hypothetical protein